MNTQHTKVPESVINLKFDHGDYEAIAGLSFNNLDEEHYGLAFQITWFNGRLAVLMADIYARIAVENMMINEV